MERVCFLARSRADRLDEYRARHAEVWPEMTAALQQAGWANDTLFLSEDGLVVGYLEADYQAALERMAQSVVNARWPKSFTSTERRPRSAGWR
jgi:L-rhamnose mutarotase